MKRKSRKNLGIVLIVIGIIGLYTVSTQFALPHLGGYDELDLPIATSPNNVIWGGSSEQGVLNGHTYTVRVDKVVVGTIKAKVTVTASHDSNLINSVSWWDAPTSLNDQYPTAISLKSDASIKVAALCYSSGSGILSNVYCYARIFEKKAGYSDCTQDEEASCYYDPDGPGPLQGENCGKMTRKCVGGIYQEWSTCQSTSSCTSTPSTCSNPTGYENEVKCADGGVEIKCNSGGFWIPTGGTCGSENPPPPVPVTCGNGVIDEGEDCINCPSDIEAVKGDGYCDPECDIFCQLGDMLWYIIIGIGVVILLTAGLWPKR